MPKRHIAFVANHLKTHLFYAIAQYLEIHHGYKVIWFCPNKRWHQWLLKNNVDNGSILPLYHSYSRWHHNTDTTADPLLTQCEQALNLSVNDLILIDRNLRHYPFEQAFGYIRETARMAHEFLAEHPVDAIFMEHTWTVEVVIAAVASLANIPALEPSSVRQPSDRFAFFEHPFNNVIYQAKPFNQFKATGKPSPTEVTKPYYLNRKKERHTIGDHSWGKRLLCRVDGSYRGDPSAYNDWLLLKRRIACKWNRFFISHFCKPLFTPINRINKPFIYVTLHAQPESSIDLQSHRHSNQYHNIEQLSRITPHEYCIVVKEHPKHLGERPAAWLKQLAKLPNVYLANPFADGRKIIDRAVLTLSPAGTACLEAGLKGKASAVLTPIFFAPFIKPGMIDLQNMDINDMAQLLEKKHTVSDQDVARFHAWVRKYSHPGIVSDPVSHPDCMSVENIKAIAEAIHDLF